MDDRPTKQILEQFSPETLFFLEILKYSNKSAFVPVPAQALSKLLWDYAQNLSTLNILEGRSEIKERNKKRNKNGN